MPTVYGNSHGSGFKTQNTVITGHSSPHRRSGPLSCLSWRLYSHSAIGHCGCRNGIPLVCITSSLAAMTCSITWMVWCELWPRRRHNGRKTYTSPWGLRGRSWPDNILKWLQPLVWFRFRHISLILCGSCDCLGSGTSESTLILKTRLLELPNTPRPFWGMGRTNPALNIDVCWSQHPKA